MSKVNGIFRSIPRQLAILTGVIGLTFAAGIDWARAAEPGAAATSAMPGEMHVIFLFLLALGVLAASVFKPRKRARAKGRARHPRSPRR